MMEPRTLEFIAESCHGQLVTGERSVCVNHVCTDSRLAKPGENGSTDGARAQFSLWMTCSRSPRLARSSAVDWEAA